MSQGNVDIALFGSLILTLSYCKTQTDKLTGQVNNRAIQYVDLKKMRDFLDEAPQMVMGNKETLAHFPYGDLVLNKISFAYEQEKSIVTDMDLVLPAGSVTAFV